MLSPQKRRLIECRLVVEWIGAKSKPVTPPTATPDPVYPSTYFRFLSHGLFRAAFLSIFRAGVLESRLTNLVEFYLGEIR